MADYKLNQQTREQTRAFVDGFRSIITEGWIKVFSPPELQRYGMVVEQIRYDGCSLLSLQGHFWRGYGLW